MKSWLLENRAVLSGIAIAIIGIAFSLYEPRAGLAFSGSMIGLTIGLLFRLQDKFSNAGNILKITDSISNKEHLSAFEEIGQCLSASHEYKDNGIYLELLNKELDGVKNRMKDFSAGIHYYSGETWVYEWDRIIRQEGVTHYYSTAPVMSETYWQNGAGAEAGRITIELANNGLEVTKIFILSAEMLTSDKVFRMIKKYAESNVYVYVTEWKPHFAKDKLDKDFGVYGEEATGFLTPAIDGSTQEFTLHFSKSKIKENTERFKTLLRFANKESTRLYFASHKMEYLPS